MELIFILIVSTLFLSLQFLPYFYALSITPKGFIFLGVTHYAYDYFYYLSHMAQGASHFFFSTNLHTGEPQAYTYIGWVYVLWGRIFSLLGIVQTAGYQLASFFTMLLFLFILYRFFVHVFADSWSKRVSAFGLFLFSNAFIAVQNGQLTFFDTWNNFGSPFIRLDMVPHHILTQVLLVASLFLVLSKRLKPFMYSCQLSMISFLLSTLQPLQWMLMGASIGSILFLLKPSLKALLPGFLWIAAGLPSIFTLRALFQTQPYINTLIWEAGQQQVYSIIDYFKFNGIVAISGVIGLPLLFKRNTQTLTFLMFYSLLSLVLFFSPIPRSLNLLNIRFLSSLPTLLFAVSAVELLSFARKCLAKLAGDTRGRDPDSAQTRDHWREGQRVAGPAMIIIFTIFLAPPLYLQMKQRLVYDTNNAYFYLPKEAYDTLRRAEKVSSLDDAFLVQWPFSAPFTGLSGRREYHSNFLATINSIEKEARSRTFFEGKMDQEEMKNFLQKHGITRVIAYPWNFPNIPPLLKQLYKTDMLAIYSVDTTSY